MARKSNVNPDHYKTAGRDPQGQSVGEVERQKLKEEMARLSRAIPRSVPAPRPKQPSAVPRPSGPSAEPAVKDVGENLQGSDKRGKVAMAKKRANSRHGLGSTPSTRPVAGAYGKRKAAAEILSIREEYNSRKQSQPAKKTSATKKKSPAKKAPAAKRKSAK